jgi:hypothetical protein
VRRVLEKSCVDTQNTHFIFNNFFLNRAAYEIMWKKNLLFMLHCNNINAAKLTGIQMHEYLFSHFKDRNLKNLEVKAWNLYTAK